MPDFSHCLGEVARAGKMTMEDAAHVIDRLQDTARAHFVQNKESPILSAAAELADKEHEAARAAHLEDMREALRKAREADAARKHDEAAKAVVEERKAADNHREATIQKALDDSGLDQSKPLVVQKFREGFEAGLDGKPRPEGDPARSFAYDMAEARRTQYEAGAEGKPQGLIPGVAPVTDAERIGVQAAKPLRGGEAPPPAGGLFDEGATNQGEMFLRPGQRPRGPYGPEAESRKRPGRQQLPDAPEAEIGPKVPTSPEEARALQLDTSMRQIAERLGRRLEVDKSITPGALGTYRPKDGVLRIRMSGDIEVFAHELGHAVDHILSNDDATKAAWRGFRTAKPSELLPLAQQAGGKVSLEEGVAEFIRRYITNPAAAAREAPDSTLAFKAILAKRPDLAEAISETTKLSMLDDGLDGMGAFRAMIAEPEPKNILEEAHRKTLRYGFVPTMADYLSSVYGKVVNEGIHVQRFVQYLRNAAFEKTGQPMDFTPSHDPFYIWREMPGVLQGAISFLDRGVPLDAFDPIHSARSESFMKGVAKALGSWHMLQNDRHPLVVDFNAYLVARRALSEYKLYFDGQVLNPPVRASMRQAEEAIANFEAMYPNFKEGADTIFAFNRAMLQRKVDKGMIKQSVADAWVAKRGDYAPFYRDMGPDVSSGAAASGASFRSLEYDPAGKRFKGSTRDILNPLRSIIEDVGRAERAIRMNDVMVAMDDLAKQGGEFAGPFWSRIPNTELRGTTVDLETMMRLKAKEKGLTDLETDMMIAELEGMIGPDMTVTQFGRTPINGSERVMFFYQGGERQAAKLGDNELSRHLFDLMTSMSAPEMNIFMSTLGAINAGFQASITHAPRFLFGTLIRDNMTRMFIPRHMGVAGRIPFVQDMVGAYTMLADRAFYRALQERGLIRGGLYTHSAQELRGGDALEAAMSSSGLISRTLDELAQQATWADKRTVLKKVGPEFVKNGVSYLGANTIERWRNAEGPAAKVWSAITSVPHMLADALRVVEFGEAASRVGNAKLTYNYLRKQGLSEADAFAAAIYEQRDVLNYSSTGSALLGKGFARVFPFMNAGMQGAERSARGLIGEPVAALARMKERGGWDKLDQKDQMVLSAAWKNWIYAGAMAGIGAAIYYPWVKDSLFYQRQTDQIRRDYWLIPLPWTDSDGTPMGLTIHKGYDIPAAIQNAFLEFSEEVRSHHPVQWGKVFGALKEAVPRQFRSFEEALNASPPIKTAYEVATGMKLDWAGGPPAPIVPEHLKRLPLEMQISTMTRQTAIGIGHALGVSPVVVQHVMDNMGGTAIQDINTMIDSMSGANPMISRKDAMIRFFVGQVVRSARGQGAAGRDIRDMLYNDKNGYWKAAAGYKENIETGNTVDAQEAYNRANDETKALMTLQTYNAFKPDTRNLHPLQNADAISKAIYPMTRNLTRNQIVVQDRSHKRGEQKEIIGLSPEQSRAVNSQLTWILSEENRNALAMVKAPGYEDYDIVDTSPRIEMLRNIAPAVADELERRMETLHVLPAKGVESVWAEAKTRLLKDQSKAKLSDLLRRAQHPQGASQ